MDVGSLQEAFKQKRVEKGCSLPVDIRVCGCSNTEEVFQTMVRIKGITIESGALPQHPDPAQCKKFNQSVE